MKAVLILFTVAACFLAHGCVENRATSKPDKTVPATMRFSVPQISHANEPVWLTIKITNNDTRPWQWEEWDDFGIRLLDEAGNPVGLTYYGHESRIRLLDNFYKGGGPPKWHVVKPGKSATPKLDIYRNFQTETGLYKITVVGCLICGDRYFEIGATNLSFRIEP